MPPAIESLESRLTPAMVTLAGGNLLIGAQVGTLYVEAVGPNQVRVHDSATDATYSGPLTRVRVTDTPGNDQVWVTATAAALNANLELRGGRGNDLFELGGTFNGSVSAVGSTSGPAGNLQVYFETVASTVNGNLTYTGGLGTGALGVSGVDFLLTGNLNVNSFAMSDMQLWCGDFGATGSTQEILGSVNYSGGAGNDAVLFYTTTAGAVSLNFGNGVNVFADTPDCLYSSFAWTGGPNTSIYLLGTVA